MTTEYDPAADQNQGSLFDADHTQVRRSDPGTSADAAAMNPGRRNSMRRRMAQAIADAHPFPLNWDQAADAAGISPKSSPWRALTSLRRAGVIEAMGTTTTSSGAQATAYIITADGWKALHDE